jgi:hypothetical protein
MADGWLMDGNWIVPSTHQPTSWITLMHYRVQQPATWRDALLFCSNNHQTDHQQLIVHNQPPTTNRPQPTTNRHGHN